MQYICNLLEPIHRSQSFPRSLSRTNLAAKVILLHNLIDLRIIDTVHIVKLIGIATNRENIVRVSITTRHRMIVVTNNSNSKLAKTITEAANMKIRANEGSRCVVETSLRLQVATARYRCKLHQCGLQDTVLHRKVIMQICLEDYRQVEALRPSFFQLQTCHLRQARRYPIPPRHLRRLYPTWHGSEIYDVDYFHGINGVKHYDFYRAKNGREVVKSIPHF